MSSGVGSSGEQRGGAVFYRFTDSSGTVHIVDSLDRVPAAQRERAERIQYDDSLNNGEAPHQHSVSVLQPPAGLSGWPMFGLGAGAVLLMVVLLRVLPGARGTLLRAAIALAVVALLGGAYLGWARRVTHQSGDLLASPSALMDDAKSAVEKMNARLKDQQRQLKEAEQSK
jgi:hypothetical protein